MSDTATKAFKQFAKEQDFFKRDTAGRLEPLYRALIGAGHSPLAAIEMLESAISAIRNEYGD